VDFTCFECNEEMSAETLIALGDLFVEHARNRHDWPYPDQAVRNYAEATQRLTGPSDRVEQLGEIHVEKVDTQRIDDWLRFFDHDAFVGTPEWADCYCLEPHVRRPDEPPSDDAPAWNENRQEMVSLLQGGKSFGYLAYEGERPIGWVNASLRSDYSLYSNVDKDGPNPEAVIGISCFIVSPPYRRHNVAATLLDRVISDANERGASWIEAYPFNDSADSDSGNFRGPRSMYEIRGFKPVETRERDTVVRRPVS
jgi:GNAT superfamily N-acetyltransferase